MLDINFICDNAETVKANCLRRNVDSKHVDDVIHWNTKRKEYSKGRDELVHKRRQVQNGIVMVNGESRVALMEEAKQWGIRIDVFNDELKHAENELQKAVRLIPNLTHPDVKDENVTIKKAINNEKLNAFLEVPDTYFDKHLDIGVREGLFDFKNAADISGNKFYYLKNDGVLLEQALIQLGFAAAAKHGFTLFSCPDIARAEVIEELGFVPRGESSQIYNIEGTDQCLVGTAEITLGAMHRKQLLDRKDLPLKYAGLSHCFRKEAGAPGKQDYGLFRVHQFSKVELFVFTNPEDSDKELDKLVAIQEEIYTALGLPYRVVDIGVKDLGNPAYRKYDLEVWMPGRGDFGEVTSASNCTDYQARRLNTRCQDPFKPTDKRWFVHTLNATAMAVPRTILAILENNYDARLDVIKIPAVLQSFMGKEKIG